ncbi:MAG: rod shape-determining protein [Allosphingosinicella sp.]
MGIDLGTANTRIFMPERGIALNQPSVVAIESFNGKRRIRAAGDDAKMLMGKTPDQVELVRPLRHGALAGFQEGQGMLRQFIDSLRPRRVLEPSLQVIISTPALSTEVHRRAVRDAAREAGAKKVWLIEGPMAAAIGADLPVTEPIGSMVVDIGAGKTEVALFMLRRMVFSVDAATGGDQMDDAIATYVRRNHNLLIGDATAERIKKQIGLALPPSDGDGHVVYIKGRDLRSGAPKEITLSQRQVAEALAASVGMIVEAVRMALDNCPDDIAADLVDQGMVLTGGGALLSGMDEVLRNETGLPVEVGDDPLTCVARGIGRVLTIPVYRSALVNV